MRYALSLKPLGLFFLLLLFCVGGFGTSLALAAASDVRILIDVSGSMKRNDPNNLRVPALRLVSELMPADARAGVWLFAEDTNALSPLGPADAAWKERTGNQLNTIHSRGLRTDIAGAITTATADWSASDPDTARHLILLTDGLVDVSTDPDANAASRTDIISTQIPRLRQLGVQAHTIALSNEADSELMEQLSGRTGGRQESADTAEQLQRIFLRLLEQSAPPTTVPLQGNRFNIDDQISEFTLLAFREPGAQTRLIAPDETAITAESVPQESAWRAEAGYDLATITKPQPGEWRLDGVDDPDNRVAIVTDLSMELSALPSVLRLGETRELAAWLTSAGAPVTRTDLLQLLTATAQLIPTDSSVTPPASQPTAVNLTLDPETGRFAGRLQAPMVGEYRLQVIIDGGTFQRQLVRPLRVLGAAFALTPTQQLPTDEQPEAALDVALEFDQEMIDPGSLAGFLLVQGPDGKPQVAEITPARESPLRFRFPALYSGDYLLEGRVFASDRDGQIQRFAPPMQTISFDIPGSSAPAGGASIGPVNWLRFALYLLVGNAILALLLLPTWLLLRQRADGASRPEKKKKKKKKSRKKSEDPDPDDNAEDTPDAGDQEEAP